TFHTAPGQGALGSRALLALANDDSWPPFVRASAMAAAAAGLVPTEAEKVVAQLRSDDAAMRLAALQAAELVPPELRTDAVASLLFVPVRPIRGAGSVLLS